MFDRTNTSFLFCLARSWSHINGYLYHLIVAIVLSLSALSQFVLVPFNLNMVSSSILSLGYICVGFLWILWLYFKNRFFLQIFN